MKEKMGFSGQAQKLGQLYEVLKSVDYDWLPQSPQDLQKMRDGPQMYSELTRYFGMGLPLIRDELSAEGLLDYEIQIIEESSQIFGDRLSIARVENLFVPYHHWCLNAAKPDYVYCGPETFKLIEFLKEHFGAWKNARRILDFGSSSGVLGAFLMQWLEEENCQIKAIDVNPRAVILGQRSFEAQNQSEIQFIAGDVGHPKIEEKINDNNDLIVFNPPMIIPDKNDFKLFRDSEDLGTEVPLLFLKSAERLLNKNGNLFCLITNPIVYGQSYFFQKLKNHPWKIRHKKCLNPFFNQKVAKDRGYLKMGIERIELWALYLQL